MLSLLGTAILAGCLAVAVPPPPSTAAPTVLPACTTPQQTDCVESATANGVATTPGTDGSVRDFPYVAAYGTSPAGLEVGVLHDSTGDGTATGVEVSPNVTYVLVVRSSNVYARALYGTLRDARFSADTEFGEQRRITVSFRPTPVNLRTAGTCVVGSCGTTRTEANVTRTGVARGYIRESVPDLAFGYDTRGIVSVTNAQASRVRINYVNHTYVAEVANARLTPSGAKAPGYVEVLLPHLVTEQKFEMPDVRTAGKSRFAVTRLVGKKNIAVPFALAQESNGVRIRIGATVFPTSTYRIHVKPSPPGVPRAVQPYRTAPSRMAIALYPPWATGGSPLQGYQGRCRVVGTTKWFIATGKRGVVVGGVPDRPALAKNVACQVRVKNRLGYGAWSALKTQA